MEVRVASLLMPLLLAAATLGADFDTTFPEDANKEAVIHHLRPALQPIDSGARVYTVVDCRTQQATRFPRVTLQTPRKAKTGINAIREIFAKNKRTTVAVGPRGMPRITIGKAPSALLQTKIHRLRFSPLERYN